MLSRTEGQAPLRAKETIPSKRVKRADSGAAATRREACRPSARTGSVRAKPASGPAAPMSISAERVRGSWRSRITAPSVPISERIGAGMKNGQIASPPWRRASRKCAISWVSGMASSAAAKASARGNAWAGPPGRSARPMPASSTETAVRPNSARLNSGGNRPLSVPGSRAGGVSSAGRSIWSSRASATVLRRGAPGLAARRSGEGRGDGGDGRCALGIELLDDPAVDPQPEEGLLRFAIGAEPDVAGRARERLVHAPEQIAQLIARLRVLPLDQLAQDPRSVVPVRLQVARDPVVRAVVLGDELLGRRPLALQEEAVDEDRALHVLRRAHAVVDQVGAVPEVRADELDCAQVVAPLGAADDVHVARLAAGGDHVLRGDRRRDQAHRAREVGDEERVEVDDGRGLALELLERPAAAVRIGDLLRDLLLLLEVLLALAQVVAADHARDERLEGGGLARIALERADRAAARIERIPEVGHHLVAVGRVGLQNAEAPRVQLLLRVVGHRLGLRAVGQHVAEHVVAHLGQVLGARERDHRHAELLRARGRGGGLGEPDGSEDGDHPVARQFVDRAGGAVRLVVRVLHLDPHGAVAEQVDAQGDGVEDGLGEDLEVAGEGQNDPDQVRLHRGGARGQGGDRLRRLGDGAGRLRGEDLLRQLAGVRTVADMELDTGELERRERPRPGAVVELRDQLRDLFRRRHFESAAVFGEALLLFAARVGRLDHPGRETQALCGPRVRPEGLGQDRLCLALLLLAHLAQAGPARRLAQLALHERQLEGRALLEPARRVLLQIVLQGGLRPQPPRRALERLRAPEPSLVGQRAAREVALEGSEHRRRLVEAPRRERRAPLSEGRARRVVRGRGADGPFGPRPAACASEHCRGKGDHGTGGDAEVKTERCVRSRDHGPSLYRSSWTFAPLGTSKWKRASGSALSVFASEKIRRLSLPWASVTRLARTVPLPSTAKTTRWICADGFFGRSSRARCAPSTLASASGSGISRGVHSRVRQPLPQRKVKADESSPPWKWRLTITWLSSGTPCQKAFPSTTSSFLSGVSYSQRKRPGFFTITRPVLSLARPSAA